MAKAEARGYVSLQCTVCGARAYRAQKRMKGAPYKLELQKYCSRERKRTLHKEAKK